MMQILCRDKNIKRLFAGPLSVKHFLNLNKTVMSAFIVKVILGDGQAANHKIKLIYAALMNTINIDASVKI